MQFVKWALVVCAVAAIATGAIAQTKPKDTFESLWRDATEGEHTLTEYDDYTMVETGGGVVYYYFTKSNHYAYPGVIRRALTQVNGRYFVDTQGWSFASEAGQPGFKRWLDEFKALNRRLIEALTRQQQQSQ